MREAPCSKMRRWVSVIGAVLIAASRVASQPAPPGDAQVCSALLGVPPDRVVLSALTGGASEWPAPVARYRFHAAGAGGSGEDLQGDVLIDAGHHYVVQVRFDRPQGGRQIAATSAGALTACAETARAFATRALGEWSAMHPLETLSIPPDKPMRRVFRWEQRDPSGTATGTQAGVVVSALDGRIVSYAGRRARPAPSRPQVAQADAIAAVRKTIAAENRTATTINARLQLSWIRAPGEGPVWFVQVTSVPVGADSTSKARVEEGFVIDAVSGSELPHLSG